MAEQRLLAAPKAPRLLVWNPPPDIPSEAKPSISPSSNGQSVPNASESVLRSEGTVADIRPVVPSAPTRKPHYELFVGILGIGFAVLIPVLQTNGVEINLEWSAIVYGIVIIGAVWSFLTHAVPHRGKSARWLGSIALVAIFGALACLGIDAQYRMQHPIVPALSIVAGTLPGLPVGMSNDPALCYRYIAINNNNEVEIDNVRSRLQLPEPIYSTIETNLPTGTAIGWKPILTKYAISGSGNRTILGPNSSLFPIYTPPSFIPLTQPGHSAQLTEISDRGTMTGVWELVIDKIPPHSSVRISFLTANQGDATNYIAFANTQFQTNGASIRIAIQGTNNGSVILHEMSVALIVQTNKDAKLTDDWRLGTNELRFCFQGLYQYPSATKLSEQYFLVPFIFDPHDRSMSSLPTQQENGRWRRVEMEYQ